jgi:hypothetical protein
MTIIAPTMGFLVSERARNTRADLLLPIARRKYAGSPTGHSAAARTVRRSRSGKARLVRTPRRPGCSRALVAPPRPNNLGGCTAIRFGEPAVQSVATRSASCSIGWRGGSPVTQQDVT